MIPLAEHKASMSEAMEAMQRGRAAKISDRLDHIRAQLVTLHADAEALKLPQGVVMGLHWLCEDADKTLAHLKAMEAITKEDRQEQTGDQPDMFSRN